MPLDPDVAEAVARLSPAEREHFEERAAILEYDAGAPRREAERWALAEVWFLAGRRSDASGTPDA
jgi:hypothetical protein